jgi:hypothetical protein
VSDIQDDAARLWLWIQSSEPYVQKFQTQQVAAMRELVGAGLVRETHAAGSLIEVELTPEGEVLCDR